MKQQVVQIGYLTKMTKKFIVVDEEGKVVYDTDNYLNLKRKDSKGKFYEEM